ncbi:MAG: RNase adapter RapZ [Anaerovorax sp.]
MNVVIVTGLSGAGKSQTINCIEDLGYYCVDNMPPALIKDFVTLCVNGKMDIEHAAFVVDIRGGEFFDDLKSSLEGLRESGIDYKVLFLEASDEALIRRFNETRRNHPLATNGTVIDGITNERAKLMEMRRAADFIIDTSNMKPAMLSDEIKRMLISEEDAKMFTITIKSFGYKYGIPLDSDIIFDVRFIPNPFYLSSMKKLTGNSKKVQDYVMKFPESKDFVKTVDKLINDLIPNYMREGKSHLVIGFGCTGGQHRSVTMANQFAELFLEQGKRVIKVHRDL